MGVDINLVRCDKGGDPEVVRSSEIRRGRDGSAVTKVIEADDIWRKSIFAMEQAKKELNALNKAVGQRKKANPKDDCQDLVDKATAFRQTVVDLEKKVVVLEKERDAYLHSIGNIVHSSVVDSSDETHNEIVRTWGHVDRSMIIDGTLGRMHHHEVLARLNGYDPKKGVEVAGHRGYFLKGYGAMLNMALINYGQAYLRRQGYTTIQVPFFMRREVMAQTAELKDFEETLYRIPMGSETVASTDPAAKEAAERDDLFLIATSEQPISALHRKEFLEEKTLPYRYAGFSTCFRKEAGSHGKDTWGIFRIHQFEKVEQFVICKPEDSWDFHEEMIKTAEEFYQTLQLPYRIVSIVAGALNDAAAKKYDLEAWFPGYGDFRELVSCSNCTDYQSRALEVRLGHPKQGEREKSFVHMLNATLVATQRCLCCILENYQTPEGVRIPDVLVPYMDGMTFIPYPKQA